jgi:hypothetical protein
MKKRAINSSVRIDAYKVIDEAVDKGTRYGYRRAHTYVDQPSEDLMIEEIHRAIMNELCEILRFDEEE